MSPHTEMRSFSHSQGLLCSLGMWQGHCLVTLSIFFVLCKAMGQRLLAISGWSDMLGRLYKVTV